MAWWKPSTWPSLQTPEPVETRAYQYAVTNTLTGGSQTFSILTPADCGWGPSWSWDPWYGVMSIPAARRCALLISDLIGSLPLHGYRQYAGQPTERIYPTPPLLADPSPPSTRMDVMASWVLDYLFHGNAIGVITGWNSEGWPTSVLPVPADTVSTCWGEDGTQVYDVNGQAFGPAQVFHVRGPHRPGELRGYGLLETALGAFDLAQEQRRQASNMANHGVPSVAVKTTNPDVTTEDLLDAKTAWMTAQSTRSPAFLAPGMDVVPLSWNPEELQLEAARRMTAEEMAQLFGVPLRYIGMSTGGLSYSNPTLDAIDLMKFSIDPHLERFEQEWSRHMPRGSWAKYNRDTPLRADTTTRYAAYTTALAAGFLTIDEVRDLEDLPPLEDTMTTPEQEPDENENDLPDDAADDTDAPPEQETTAADSTEDDDSEDTEEN